MRLCSTLPNVHDLEQARWSLCNSSHVVMFSATVKVSKVKAIQHKFWKKPALFSRDVFYQKSSRRRPKKSPISMHPLYCPYSFSLVDCAFKSVKLVFFGSCALHWKIHHCISVCLWSLVIHQLLNTFDILKLLCISLFHLFFFKIYWKFRFALKAQVKLFWMK